MARIPQKPAIPVDGAENTTLRPVDHEAFFAKLDTPPAPTEKVRTAFARHRAAVVSRSGDSFDRDNRLAYRTHR